jgi:thiol-disulfide isomerase/thioredoxin
MKNMRMKNEIHKRIETLEKSYHLFFIVCMFMACTQAENTAVRGHIEGLSNDTVFVIKVPFDNFGEQQVVQDTVLCKNGLIEYIIPADGTYGLIFSFPQFFIRDRPTGGFYKPDISSLTLFTESGDKIRFKGTVHATGLRKVSLSGSKLNRAFSPIQNKILEIRKNEVKEEMALEQAMVDKNKEKEDMGWAKRKERNNAIRELFGNYIKTNLDNPLSAFLLYQQPLDSAGLYYDKLGDKARNSMFRHMLDQQMKRYMEYINVRKSQEEIIVGKKAPDFTLEDMNGKYFTLSSLQGKYVIIDFWGSWCAPCIAGIPKMKGVYEKYKNKLEILGVACNEESVEGWKESVMQHKLPWINVYNDKQSAINVKYGIDAYPTKIVIDPEGSILMRETGEGDNFYKKLDSLALYGDESLKIR